MKNKSILFSLLLLATTIVSCGQAPDPTDSNKLSAEEYATKIKNTVNAQYIDVRTFDEFASGRIKGFINIDYKNENFKTEIAKLDKSKPTFIYCRSGKRSAAANDIMNKLGFKEVYDLEGGIISWQESGKPVE